MVVAVVTRLKSVLAVDQVRVQVPVPVLVSVTRPPLLKRLKRIQGKRRATLPTASVSFVWVPGQGQTTPCLHKVTTAFHIHTRRPVTTT